MQRLLLAGGVLFVLGACATSVHMPTDNLVIIDTTESAFTVFIAISGGKLEEVKGRLPREAKVDIVSSEAFRDGAERYVASRILKDEYPGSRAVDGVVELISRYPETPIGLTWNGGVAITFNDYRHAKSTYQRYQADPVEYERTRVRDPRADPVNPAAHLGPLLGW